MTIEDIFSIIYSIQRKKVKYYDYRDDSRHFQQDIWQQNFQQVL